MPEESRSIYTSKKLQPRRAQGTQEGSGCGWRAGSGSVGAPHEALQWLILSAKTAAEHRPGADPEYSQTSENVHLWYWILGWTEPMNIITILQNWGEILLLTWLRCLAPPAQSLGRRRLFSVSGKHLPLLSGSACCPTPAPMWFICIYLRILLLHVGKIRC